MRQDSNAMLLQILLNVFGHMPEDTLAFLNNNLRWLSVRASESIITQGQIDDSMYMVVSGRFRAYVRHEHEEEKLIREIARGEIIGELSLITEQPRSATVVAIRDSVVVQLDKKTFEQLVQRSPQLLLNLTKKIITRFQSPNAYDKGSKPIVIGLIPISAGLQTRDFAEKLAAFLPLNNIIIDANQLNDAIGMGDLANAPVDDDAANQHIALYLENMEAEHDQVILVADATATLWSKRCTSRCDEILLLADAMQSPDLHATESMFLCGPVARREVIETLVLCYPDDLACPNRSSAWINRRHVHGHHNIRLSEARDIARLARYISHTSVGLVLAGGGARGLAQLGIYRALQERGIDVDFVGGTSIGSIVAALIASNRPWQEITLIARNAFLLNPTKDFNLIPLISLISGRRLRRLMTKAVEETFHSQPRIEDLWKNYYCIASNYTKSQEQCIQKGPLFEAILASIALPGAFPPVLDDGDLLCDGGVLNNFPVDVMREIRGVGFVIGADSGNAMRQKVQAPYIPTTALLLFDLFRPKHKRRFRLPSLITYLSNVTVMYSYSRKSTAKKLTDLYFNPELKRTGMLSWSRFDQIVESGYRQAIEVLDATSNEKLDAIRGKNALPPLAGFSTEKESKQIILSNKRA